MIKLRTEIKNLEIFIFSEDSEILIIHQPFDPATVKPFQTEEDAQKWADATINELLAKFEIRFKKNDSKKDEIIEDELLSTDEGTTEIVEEPAQ